MKVSYNWIKQYINTEINAQQAATHLTAIGLEVESLEKAEAVKGGLAGLVVGQVITCEKHPDADKLNITTVSVGDGTDVLQVVCGAANCRAGIKVVLAPVGSVLYPISMNGDALKIKRSKIRGVESLGMLCAEDEIGVGESHDGIIVLDDSCKVGSAVAEVFALSDDYIMEIGLTPNRIDAASHYGVARDLGAFLSVQSSGARAELPSVSEFQALVSGASGAGEAISVRVDDSVKAPRYMGVTIRGVKNGPSPEWIQSALRSIGINPKNSIVDITNFVLHECGQPLHAFDATHIGGREIVVRSCDEGTKFTTLDGVQRTLSAEDLMICDAQKPMCLAGVFGGMDSGVSDETTDIFIESAYFNPVTVRKSARRHGLSTDSSFRFERGADPQMAQWALARAATLVIEHCGGGVVGGVVDVYPNPINDFKFNIDLGRIYRLLGKELDRDLVLRILRGLDIEATQSAAGDPHDPVNTCYQVTVPSYRVDVQRECDIAEEILRIYGFNNIENPDFIKNAITSGNRPTADRMVDTISNLFAAMGATEIMNNSLTRASYYQAAVAGGKCVKILNPLSGELNVMRGTLLFGALESVALNSARRNSDLRFFEFGNCYFYDPTVNQTHDQSANENGKSSALRAYSQGMRLGITVTGVEQAASWNRTSTKTVDIYSLKLYFERMMQRLGLNIAEGIFSNLETLENQANQESGLGYYSVGSIYTMRGHRLMEMGRVNDALCRSMEIKAPVYYMEIDVDRLFKLASTVTVRASELSKFQRVSRDLALLVDQGVMFSELRNICMKAERKLLTGVNLFDVYQGDKVPKGKKSYAINLTIEDKSRTLTDSDIENIMTRIIRDLENVTGAQIRS